MDNFNLYSKYYDLLYRDKDYAGEAKYVYETLLKHNNHIHDIIELGSGTGNHAKFLTNFGLHVTGIERSGTMVKEAVAKQISDYEPIIGDMTDFSIGKKFDAAIALFHVISYLNDNDEIKKCFRCVHKHLESDGIFLFDVWFTPAVYTQKPETRIKRFSNDNIDVVRLAESTCHYDTNVVDVNFEVHITDKCNGGRTIINEVHKMRHFSIPEMALLADDTGFDILKTEEFVTSNLPSCNTWGVCFILKKR